MQLILKLRKLKLISLVMKTYLLMEKQLKRSITTTTTTTATYHDFKDIRKRISIAKNAVIALSNTWKNKSISLKTKKRLLNTLVFPVATYGLECWVVKQSDRKRLASFELWSYH